MAIRLRYLIASCLLVITVARLSQCQRRRECDCASDGNITYVCLLRCGRGSSGGNVVIMPVKKVPIPFPFLTFQEKLAPNQVKPKLDIDATRNYHFDSHPANIPLPFLTNAMNKLRDLLNLKEVLRKDGLERAELMTN